MSQWGYESERSEFEAAVHSIGESSQLGSRSNMIIRARLDLARLGIFLEVIEDRLPSQPLHLSRVFFLCIEYR